MSDVQSSANPREKKKVKREPVDEGQLPIFPHVSQVVAVITSSDDEEQAYVGPGGVELEAWCVAGAHRLGPAAEIDLQEVILGQRLHQGIGNVALVTEERDMPDEDEPEYDEDESHSSEDPQSDEEHFADEYAEEPDDGVFVYVEAPFNRDVAKRWSNRLAMRQLRYGCLSWSDFLGGLALRALPAAECKARRLPSGSWTLDRFKEPAAATTLGLKGSLEPSADRTCNDEKLKHEKAGGHLRGLSVFAGPKLLRFLARVGVKAQIYDVVNSHLTHLHNALPEVRRPLELVEIVNSRRRIMDELLSEVSNSSGRLVQLADIKKLILSISYGGNPKRHLKLLGCSSVPAWLSRFKTCIREIANNIAKEMPERIQALKDMDKRDPVISLLSYLVSDLQRQTTDKMKEAVQTHGRVVSYERDCIVGMGKCSFDDVSVAAGVPITVEAYESEEAVLVHLRKKYPFSDFGVNSEFDYQEVAKARACCVKALQPVITPDKKDGPPKVTFPTPKNTTDFGLVVASHLEPTVICGEGKMMEFWAKSANCKHGKWNTVTDRDAFLTMLTRKTLLTIFLPTKLEVEDGKWVPREYGVAPPSCKYRGFYVQVAADAGLVLRRPRPPSFVDNVDTREFLQDRHGLIYSFNTDSFYASEPAIRVSLNLPWTFFNDGSIGTPDEVWKAPVETKSGLLEILLKIFDYYLSGSGPEGKSLEADPEIGKSLADELRSFIDKDPCCKVWHLLMPFMNHNVDKVIWLLNQHTADAAAWVRRTEANYLYGDAGCGKDVLAMLLMTFFGDRKTGGYTSIFPHNYFVGKSGKTEIKSILDTAKGARLVINNEVPDHNCLNHEEMKPLTESRGTGITTRTIYALPETWQPFCGVLMMGNYRTKLSPKQMEDSGIRRRLNVMKLNGTYSKDEEKDVKDDIQRGAYNHELFWLFRVFFKHYLSKLPANWTRIHPRPLDMVAQTDELFDTELLEKVKNWIEEFSIPANSYKEASTITAVKMVVSNLIGFDYKPQKNDPEFSERLKTFGLEEARDGSKRVMTYIFPDMNRRKGIKLLSEPAADADEMIEG